MMLDLEPLDERYPDEAWWVTVDWSPAVPEGASIVGTPSVVPLPSGAFVIDNISHAGMTTTFLVHGGSERSSSARIAMLALMSNDSRTGYNLPAPIRPR